MAEARKQAISLRLGAGDIGRIKKLADRFGTRDSDVVRFAIKMMLHRMRPQARPLAGDPDDEAPASAARRKERR